METHEDTMKRNYNFFSILMAGTAQKCPTQAFNLEYVGRLWCTCWPPPPGTWSSDPVPWMERMQFPDQTTICLLSDKADIYIQRKHIRKVVLLRITQGSLLRLIRIHILAGKSHEENHAGFHIFNFSRRCDCKAIMEYWNSVNIQMALQYLLSVLNVHKAVQ